MAPTVDLVALSEDLARLDLAIELTEDSLEIDQPWTVVFRDGEVQVGFTRIKPGDARTWDMLFLIHTHLHPDAPAVP